MKVSMTMQEMFEDNRKAGASQDRSKAIVFDRLADKDAETVLGNLIKGTRNTVAGALSSAEKTIRPKK